MTESEKLQAIRLARNAIESELLRSPLATSDQLPPVFSEPGAVFVTLKMRNGTLRGCVGSLLAHRSLYEDITQNALASAFSDPRFPPLNAQELADIKIELSLLTTPIEIVYSSTEALLEKIVPFEDGLIIKSDDHQATFLPAVWSEIGDKQEFLSRLCQKAGLEADFWRGGTLEVYAYKADNFNER